MSRPFTPRPAQVVVIPEYLTLGLYVLMEAGEFDEINLHKMLLDKIAQEESGRRGRLNQWKTDSRLRFEIVPAEPIVSMYEDFMPFFGISEQHQNQLRNTAELIAVVCEQDMTKEANLGALRILQTATALTAKFHKGLILDPLSYKVLPYENEQCKLMQKAFASKNPLAPVLSVIQTPKMTSTSGLCRFSLPEISIDKTDETFAPQVKELTAEIARSVLDTACAKAKAGEKEINLEAPLMVRDKPVFLRLQHSKLGPVLNLNLHGRKAEREESLKSLL
jgi:hypothetical protein